MAENEQKSGYSHIVVGGDFEDDDVVIVAGARNATSVDEHDKPDDVEVTKPVDEYDSKPPIKSDAPDASEPHEHLQERGVATSATSLSPDESKAVAPDDAGEASAEDLEVSVQEHSASSGKKEDYRATTLEDLEGTKMPATQKIVIAVAVVLIVCAIAWYFLH